jgi:hypothetical protein
MANIIIIKWGILPTYLPYSTTFLPTYLLQLVPTYLPTYYNLSTYLPTYYNLFTYHPLTYLL